MELKNFFGYSKFLLVFLIFNVFLFFIFDMDGKYCKRIFFFEGGGGGWNCEAKCRRHPYFPFLLKGAKAVTETFYRRAVPL